MGIILNNPGMVGFQLQISCHVSFTCLFVVKVRQMKHAL